MSSNEVVEIGKEVVIDYRQNAMRFLQTQLKGLNGDQQEQFLSLCEYFGLNPFAREIYGIPYKDKFNIIVGYETYIKRAERSGKLVGWRAWTEGAGADLKGCIEINRSDFRTPFYHEVYFDEYTQNNTMWNSKPRTMIKKVAIAQGFRLCFSVELGGIPYTSDEIEVEAVNHSPEIIENKPPTNTSTANPKAMLVSILKQKGLIADEIRLFAEYFQLGLKKPEDIQKLLEPLELEPLIVEFKGYMAATAIKKANEAAEAPAESEGF